MIRKLLPVFLCCAAALHAQSQRFFQQNAPWFQDVSSAALDSQSSQIITWLSSNGGWGNGRLQIDFSIEVLTADQTAPFKVFTPTGDFYTPDCDHVPVPVPPGGNLEGETGYQCAGDGDCHLLVFHAPTRVLYEMWRANIVGQTFDGGCLAVWNLNTPWNANGRGQDCTSADAAGLQIAPLLFTADEIAAGTVEHAIRFILPNSRIRRNTYVHPATHATGAASGGSSAVPYGARFRLRSDFPLSSLPNQAARVVAAALQKYGMFLADGGTIALTAQSDNHTTAKWSGRMSAMDLTAIKVTDFQMVNGGTRYTFTGDCVRSPAVSAHSKPRSMPAQFPRLISCGNGRLALFPATANPLKIRLIELSGRERVVSGTALQSASIAPGVYAYHIIMRNAAATGAVFVAGKNRFGRDRR